MKGLFLRKFEEFWHFQWRQTKSKSKRFKKFLRSPAATRRLTSKRIYRVRGYLAKDFSVLDLCSDYVRKLNLPIIREGNLILKNNLQRLQIKWSTTNCFFDNQRQWKSDSNFRDCIAKLLRVPMFKSSCTALLKLMYHLW